MLRFDLWFRHNFLFSQPRRTETKSQTPQHKSPRMHRVIMRLIQAAESPNFRERASSINREKKAERNERHRGGKECSNHLSQVWSIIHVSSPCTPWDDLFNCSLFLKCSFYLYPSHFFSILPDPLRVLASVSVRRCLTFRPLSSEATHAWHHIHFLDASQEEEAAQWSVTEKRARRSGAKWSRAPTSTPATPPLCSDWPLYHHQVALFFCHPNWLGERPGGLMRAVEEFPVEKRGRFHPELWLKSERAGGWNSRAVVAAMWKEADYFCYKLGQGKQDKWLGLGQHRGRGKTEIGWYELQRIVGITQWLRSVRCHR